MIVMPSGCPTSPDCSSDACAKAPDTIPIASVRPSANWARTGDLIAIIPPLSDHLEWLTCCHSKTHLYAPAPNLFQGHVCAADHVFPAPALQLDEFPHVDPAAAHAREMKLAETCLDLRHS